VTRSMDIFCLRPALTFSLRGYISIYEQYTSENRLLAKDSKMKSGAYTKPFESNGLHTMTWFGR